jgi:acyl carrier protein
MEERLRRVLSDVFELEAGEITSDSSPETVVLWDSLHHLKMVSAIETVFRVKFTMKEIRSMTTVGRVREVLEHHLDGNRSRTDDGRQG